MPSEEELKGLVPVRKKVFSAFERFKLEKHVADEFGQNGLKIFERIDGEKNAEEIRSLVGVGIDEILNVLDYLEKKDAIQLKTVFEVDSEKKQNDLEKKQNKS